MLTAIKAMPRGWPSTLLVVAVAVAVFGPVAVAALWAVVGFVPIRGGRLSRGLVRTLCWAGAALMVAIPLLLWVEIAAGGTVLTVR